MKHLLTLANKLLLFIAVVALNVACGDDDSGPSATFEGSKFVFAVRGEGAASETTDYLISSENLDSGTVSVIGQGIELTGFHYYEKINNRLFTVGYQDENIATSYLLNDNGELEAENEISVPQLHLIEQVSENTLLGMNIPRDGSQLATFYEINPKDGTSVQKAQTNVFDTQLIGATQEQAYFTGIHLKDNKLYMPYMLIDLTSQTWASSNADTAFCAVFNYPSLELDTVLKDARSGVIGVYAGSGHIFETENGDIYTVSTASKASGVETKEKPSAILRIKNGAFDQNYFFDIENITDGLKVNDTYYLGNNKVLAGIYATKETEETNKWYEMGLRLSILDLNTKSITYVDNAPLYAGGPTRLNVTQKDGYAYVKLTTVDGVFIYKVDVDNATATQGAEILGGDVDGFYTLETE